MCQEAFLLTSRRMIQPEHLGRTHLVCWGVLGNPNDFENPYKNIFFYFMAPANGNDLNFSFLSLTASTTRNSLISVNSKWMLISRCYKPNTDDTQPIISVDADD
jgi:hypothetical protein